MAVAKFSASKFRSRFFRPGWKEATNFYYSQPQNKKEKLALGWRYIIIGNWVRQSNHQPATAFTRPEHLTGLGQLDIYIRWRVGLCASARHAGLNDEKWPAITRRSNTDNATTTLLLYVTPTLHSTCPTWIGYLDPSLISNLIRVLWQICAHDNTAVTIHTLSKNMLTYLHKYTTVVTWHHSTPRSFLLRT